MINVEHRVNSAQLECLSLSNSQLLHKGNVTKTKQKNNAQKQTKKATPQKNPRKEENSLFSTLSWGEFHPSYVSAENSVKVRQRAHTRAHQCKCRY